MNNYFSIDLPVYLFFGESQKKRLKARILGWDAGVFLLTSLPHSVESNTFLKIKDNKCSARLQYEDKIVSFETKVLKHEVFPAPLLYLKYPQRVTTTTVRKGKRYKTSIKGKVQDLQTLEWIACKVIDVSKKGCRIVYPADKEFNFDKQVRLTIKDENFGIIGGIYIEKRSDSSDEQRIKLGCEVISFTNEEVGRKYEELVDFHNSLSEMFEETTSKLNSIFIDE